ncbi:hypothetical protein S58_37360 [Bradyrhizobium oligotrophicum S58]|uniref:TIGR04086 family membrane protein n=1 Tax=Bradyrhizobium oligotrophicum S58 TaxID=1245469 RepID=M4Z805_9BRAD|nr:hypothetical protein S58_37360 [Bradyrhizobium oligotrophicum S58]
MKRVSLKCVVVGSVVDILSTNLAIFPVTILVFIFSGPAAAELAASDPRALMASNLFKALSFTFGTLSSVLGGYVSGRLAKHDHILNGALSSILCMGFGVYALLSGRGSLVVQLALFALTPLLGAVGGYLSARRSKPQ